MTASPLPSPLPRQLPSVRVGDAEREGVAAQLADHFAAGRLTLAEFTDRSDAAARACTGQDLMVLTADLPRLDAPRPLPPRPGRVGPAPVVLVDAFFAVFGPLALLCLLMLLGVSGRADTFFVGFFAALGGAVSCGALVHLLHRLAERRGVPQARTGWAE